MDQLQKQEIAKQVTFWYTNPLLGPHPKTLSLLGTPLTAGCELIVKNPRSLIWASFSAMTFISEDGPCSDHGSEGTFPRQKSRKTALNVSNSVGDPQVFRASSFCKKTSTRVWREVVLDAYGLFQRNTITVYLTIRRTSSITKPTVRILIPVFCSRDVRFGTVCPEDRSDGLVSTTGCQALKESQL